MNKKEHPYLKANCLSRFLFCWVSKFLRKGYNVVDSDIYDVLQEESSQHQCHKLEKKWKEELKNCGDNDDAWMLARALCKTYGLHIFLWFILFFVHEVFKITQPFLIGKLIEHFSRLREDGNNTSSKTAYIYATAICVCTILPTFLLHHFFLRMFQTAMLTRISCSSLLYKKLLRLSLGSVSSTASLGHLINLMSTDVSRFDLAFSLLPFIIMGPLELVVVTLILWFYIGWGSILASLVLLLIIPIAGVLAKVFAKLRIQITKLSDQRLGLLTEVLNGIQYVKMCCWEEMMEERMCETRRKEMAKIKRSDYVRGVNISHAFYSGKMIILAALVWFVLSGNAISAQVVFMAISMYNPLKFSMMFCFPIALQLGAEALVSVRRIQDFLTIDEIFKPINDTNDTTVPKRELNLPPSAPFISAHNLAVSWDSSGPALLSGLTFELVKNDLVMVFGAVGVGKSSLLMVLLDELLPTTGTLTKQGSIAYVSQQAWIFNGTLRDNILMGAEMRQAAYDQAIVCSCLDRDLSAMSQGDQTRVGDRGMGLSGGQKARVSLARAVYRDAQVYLMDDPLSAVDANVSLKLFELCINGCLKQKLRVLVTHQIQFLSHATKVLYLDQSQKHVYDTYEGMRASGVDLGKVVHSKKQEDLSALKTAEANEDDTMPLLDNAVITSELSRRKLDSVTEVDFKTSSHSLVAASSLGVVVQNKLEGEDVEGMHGEITAGRAIAARTYYEYMTAGSGVVAFILLLLLNITTQASFLVADWWLVYWCNAVENANLLNQNYTNNLLLYNTSNPLLLSNINPLISQTTPTTTPTTPPSSINSSFYLGIFAFWCFCVLFLAILRAIISFHLLAKSNQNLHNRMLHSVMRYPMSFFILNPAGRILNRFSKDMGSLDEMLPFILVDLINQVFMVLGIFVMLSLMNAWVLLVIVPIILLFFLTRTYFLKSFRCVKRIEAKNKGPVFSHISATFHGLLTIRSQGAEGVFLEQFEQLQDLHTASFSLLLFLGRWFAIRLELLCSVVIVVVTFAAVFCADRMDGGSVGLSLTYCISLLWLFQFAVRQSTEVENLMTHVERVVEYTKLPIEDHHKSSINHQQQQKSTNNLQKHSKISNKNQKISSAKKQQITSSKQYDQSHKPLILRVDPNSSPSSSPQWPSKGDVEFKEVCLTYKSYGPMILKNLSFKIQAGEKIGIVGRTGAGKSSLINVIFKLVSYEGSVIIDGRDIRDVDTFDVRSNISIIPQEQVIMSGSLRSNLDPEEHFTDHQIWDSLAKVKLDTVFKDSGLDHHMRVAGANLSIGQQQLLCMSRALLKKNKLLLIDEATSNVDRETDHFIQATLRDHFSDLTVLCIAHRLITVIDCDKIMMMDDGRILEFDSPHNLLSNKQGPFHELASQVGDEELHRLQKIAAARSARH